MKPAIRIGIVTAWCALFISACGVAKNAPNDDGQSLASVRAVLEAQQAAWNRGDIDGFMDGYERSDTTAFVSGDELTRGWQTVLRRYKQHYQSREAMGTLAFSDLSITPLAMDLAVADGRWQLSRANDRPHGRFTLLFQKKNGNWRIIHDTTTSASP